MIGSFLTRGIILLLGYIYPAYECFKAVERHRPDVLQLRFWCQYWIIIAILTVLERLGDTFISWLPMYSEAKLAFIVYLWYPKTKGTSYVYTTFLKPLVARHELEIDRNLNELKTKAGDMFFLYWQRGSGFIQTRFFELLQYVASQSQSSRPQAAGRPVEHAEIHSAPLTSQVPPGYQPPASHQVPSGYQPPPASYQAPPGYQPPPASYPLPPAYQMPPPYHQLPASYQALSGNQVPPASYQGVPPLLPEQQPTAPPVPSDYEIQPFSGANIRPPTGIHQQVIHKEEMDYEVLDWVEQPVPPSAPESSIKSRFYMTRSRQRINRRQQ